MATESRFFRKCVAKPAFKFGEAVKSYLKRAERGDEERLPYIFYTTLKDEFATLTSDYDKDLLIILEKNEDYQKFYFLYNSCTQLLNTIYIPNNNHTYIPNSFWEYIHSYVGVMCSVTEISTFEFNSLRDKILTKNSINLKNSKKETPTMTFANNFQFDFGPVDSATIQLSPYGLAVATPDGKYVSYNPNANSIVDVTGFTFDIKGVCYKMPAAIRDIKIGDIVVPKKKCFLYVTDIKNGAIEGIDIRNNEVSTILPVKNIFGFDFVTKIVNFVNFQSLGTPNPDNPFGNIMPLMFMSQLMNKDENNSNDNNDLMTMMFLSSMMSSGTNPFANMFNFGGYNEPAPAADAQG